MRTVAKILRARASKHSSIFCEQFEQRRNFARTAKAVFLHDDCTEFTQNLEARDLLNISFGNRLFVQLKLSK